METAEREAVSSKSASPRSQADSPRSFGGAPRRRAVALTQTPPLLQVAQPAGTAATPASSAGLDDGTSTRVGGVEMYESTRFAAAISLGKTVGVQRHRKWHPLYVAQVSFGSNAPC